MAFTKLTTSLNNHQGLSDRPNQDDGLTASQLKILYDKAPNDIKTYINDVLLAELASTTNNSSGADSVGATAIADLDGTTAQALLESIRNKLKSVADGTSGADFVNATAISGLTGTTAQALLESLKSYIDTHKSSTDHDSRYYTQAQSDNAFNSLAGVGRTTETIKGNADNLVTHQLSSDHDGRYYTETEVDAFAVKLTGDQTVAGVKTFSSSPIVPTPTTNMQSSTKKYVDDSKSVGLKFGATEIANSSTAPTTGQYLKYDGTNIVGFDGTAVAYELDELTNVTVTTPTSGQVLQYNGSEWVNADNTTTTTTEEIDSYTKLLLHFDGSDASTAITDEIGKTVTASGTAQLDTAQKKFNLSSLKLDGDSDYVSLNDSADWNFGADDFTIDTWIRFNALPTSGNYQTIFAQRDTVSTNNNIGLLVYNSTITDWQELHCSFSYNGTATRVMASPYPFATNTWYHIELCRDGNNLGLFVNGENIGSYYVGTNALYNSTSTFKIGASNATPANFFNGWIDEFRVSKGTARHNLTAFTPSTAGYTPDAYDSLLLKFDGSNDSTTFTDSAKSKTITAVGNTKLKTSITVDGTTITPKIGTAMAYFDGTGDRLTITGDSDFAFGTGDLTIDFWINVLDNERYGNFIQWTDTYSDTSFHFRLDHYYDVGGNAVYNPGFRVGNGYSGTFCGNPLKEKEWVHLAATRKGNIVNVYMDGICISRAVHDASGDAQTNPVIIGDSYALDEALYGVMDELRVSKGIARFEPATFTPSTEQYGTNTTPEAIALKFGTDVITLSETAPTSGQYLKYDGTHIVGATSEGGVSESDLEAVRLECSLEVAKAVFSMEANFSAGLNSLSQMAIDVFNDSSGIASGSSSNYTYDASNKEIDSNTSNGTTNRSSAQKTVTANGNAKISTSQAKVGSASGAFDGTADYLTVPDSDDWTFGTGNFTIQTYVYFNSLASGTDAILVGQYVNGNNYWYTSVYNRSGVYTCAFYNANSGITNHKTWTVTSEFSTSAWHHIAIVRNGNELSLYWNGTIVGTAQAFTTTMVNLASVLTIGAYYDGTLCLNGYMDEFEFVKGTARYTADFTPHTTALVPDNYTMLLLHCEGADNSTTFTDDITITGGNTAATIVSNSVTASSAPSKMFVTTKQTITSGTVTYSVSRDGGSTWTEATLNTMIDVSGQPSGTSCKVKAVSSTGAIFQIHAWALGYQI